MPYWRSCSGNFVGLRFLLARLRRSSVVKVLTGGQGETCDSRSSPHRGGRQVGRDDSQESRPHDCPRWAHYYSGHVEARSGASFHLAHPAAHDAPTTPTIWDRSATSARFRAPEGLQFCSKLESNLHSPNRSLA